MIKKFASICLLALSLQGCLFVVGAVAGVAIVGVVVYDKRSPQMSTTDSKITHSIKQKLDAAPEIKNQASIKVATFNEIVLLAGQAPNQAIIDETVAIAQTVPNIKRIYNEITINGKASSITGMSDSWITTKLKSRLIAEKDLESSQIQVVTSNGNVYLMGTVTQEQADIAVGIAQHISGVQKVVKIFEYNNSSTVS